MSDRWEGSDIMPLAMEGNYPRKRARRLLAAVSLLAALILSIWWLRPDRSPPAVTAWIPAESTALLILNRFPDDFSFLDNTLLNQWLAREDLEAVESQLAGVPLRPLLKTAGDNLSQAALVLHSLETKPSGAFRLHFTAFLLPRTTKLAVTLNWIRESVLKHFGETESEVATHSGFEILRGSEPGHFLYIGRQAEWVVTSNSSSGWQIFQNVLSGQRPSLADLRIFQDAVAAVPSKTDLLIYFRSQLQILPSFVYSLDYDTGEEHYVEL